MLGKTHHIQNLQAVFRVHSAYSSVITTIILSHLSVQLLLKELVIVIVYVFVAI